MLSAIVWTPKRHFLTSQRVFWAFVRYNPSTDDFSRRAQIKKRRGLIFHAFRQALPYSRLAQIFGYVFVSWTWILWGVEVWPFPLDCDIAVILFTLWYGRQPQETGFRSTPYAHRDRASRQLPTTEHKLTGDVSFPVRKWPTGRIVRRCSRLLRLTLWSVNSASTV